MGPQMGAIYPDQAYYEQMGKHFKETKGKFQLDPFFALKFNLLTSFQFILKTNDLQRSLHS